MKTEKELPPFEVTLAGAGDIICILARDTDGGAGDVKWLCSPPELFYLVETAQKFLIENGYAEMKT